MLDRRVMPGLVNALGDFIAPLAGRFVFGDIFSGDDTGGIAGAGRSDGVVEGIAEIVF